MSKTNVHPNSPSPPLTNQSSSQPQRSKVIHCTNSSSTSKPPTQPTRKPQSAKSILLLLDNFSLYSDFIPAVPKNQPKPTPLKPQQPPHYLYQLNQYLISQQ